MKTTQENLWPYCLILIQFSSLICAFVYVLIIILIKFGHKNLLPTTEFCPTNKVYHLAFSSTGTGEASEMSFEKSCCRERSTLG